MDNFEKSLQCMEARLKELGKNIAFSRKEPDGKVMIAYCMESFGKKYNIRIMIMKEGFAVFEMYCGIHVSRMEFMPNLSMYSQMYKPEGGLLGTDPVSQDVFFRMETCIRDAPITMACVKIMEQIGIKYLKDHYQNLKDLSDGKLILVTPRKTVKNSPYEDRSLMMDPFEKCTMLKQLMRACFANETAVEDSESSSTGSDVNEYQTVKEYQGKTYRIVYKLDKYGFLKVSAIPQNGRIFVPEAYKMTAASYIDAKNSESEYGILDLGFEGEGVHSNAQTYLSGETGVESIELMGRAVMALFDRNQYDISMICAGMPLSSDDITDKA